MSNIPPDIADRIFRMDNASLLADYVAQCQIESDADMLDQGPVTRAMGDEILIRMRESGRS